MYLCSHLHTGALNGQKRARDTLELMLKVIVSHHGGDENSAMSFGRRVIALNH